jgi:carbonic anhydrase/acetyltransferase-like protein (isoleucine patch superfamily)
LNTDLYQKNSEIKAGIMKTFSYKNKHPSLGERIFLAPGVQLIGEAILGDHVNIWFNSVVRADVNFIKIGENTNVQDMCMLHVTEQNSLTIGKNVSLGHSVVLHGCKIGDSCLIGMGAIILDGAQIGDNCLVAAGSLISPGKVFPAHSLIKGRPAVVERLLTAEEQSKIANHYRAYLAYKEEYLSDPQYL